MRNLKRFFQLLSNGREIINFVTPSKLIASQLRNPSGLLAKKVGNKMNESNKFLYELVLENIKIEQDNKLLEIGFGNGKFFRQLFSKAKGVKISGLELSKAMFKEAKKHNQDFIQKLQLELQLGSSDKIPFANSSFDVVIGINLIYFWENPNTHLQEIYRTLKPKGKLYIGIRPQAILENLPFSKFGFHLRPESEWINIFAQNGFFLQNSITQKEPLMQIGKESYPMQGLCMVFEKN